MNPEQWRSLFDDDDPVVVYLDQELGADDDEMLDWFLSHTPEDGWSKCERSDWLLWVTVRVGADYCKSILAGCECAETVLMNIPSSLVFARDAILLARKSITEDISGKELKKAASDCFQYAENYTPFPEDDLPQSFIEWSFGTAEYCASRAAGHTAKLAASIRALMIRALRHEDGPLAEGLKVDRISRACMHAAALAGEVQSSAVHSANALEETSQRNSAGLAAVRQSNDAMKRIIQRHFPWPLIWNSL